MAKRQSEINRFLNWWRLLGEESRAIIAEQVRDVFRAAKPGPPAAGAGVEMKPEKHGTIGNAPADYATTNLPTDTWRIRRRKSASLPEGPPTPPTPHHGA